MKKLLSMLMIAGFVFGFTACGEATEEVTEAPVETTTPEVVEEEVIEEEVIEETTDSTDEASVIEGEEVVEEA